MDSQKIPSASGARLSVRQLLPYTTFIRLALAWGAVAAFELGGKIWLAYPIPIATAIVCFLILFSIILFAAFGVVREADHLAHLLGEPLGTLILTFTVVSIEVILIAAVMIGPGEATTIARDSIFAVMMIILNLVTGLCLLLGGLRYGEQEFNPQGAVAYLSMIVLLTATGLILPNFLSSQDGSFTPRQAWPIAMLTGALYLVFLAMQVGRYRRFFIQPVSAASMASAKRAEDCPDDSALTIGTRDRRAVFIRSLVLAGLMLPIVLLAHHLAVLIDFGIERAKAPAAIGGVVIAIIVFTPESITSIKAALADKMQRVANLCLGAFVSTVGLTVPAVLVIGLIKGKAVVLGLSPLDTFLVGLTLVLTTLTFVGPRSSPIQGAMHLMLFATYCVLLFVP
ncbi:MAG: calcium:proton antiporter [Hyphomicrobium sp.]|uniref:calcium:proton antiporter n=1 Tax=Hyphomicrobium sp. TaxID=82 RepID=UPI003564CC08